MGSDKELNPTFKRPFSVQLIGLSGKSYIWFQPADYSDTSKLQLCSLGSICTTLVIHNIAADRPLFLEANNVQFFCTMSAHLLCAGVSDQQSWAYQEGSTRARAGGLKNLIDVYNFWSAAEWPQVLDFSAKRGEASQAAKKIRDIFLTGKIEQVHSMLSELVQYGMEDTHKVLMLFRNLYPAWLSALPAKESQYFYLKRAHVNYSIPKYFEEWFISTELKYREINNKITDLIKANNTKKLSAFKAEVSEAIKKLEAYQLELYPQLLKKSGELKKQWNNTYLLHQEINPYLKQVIEKWSQAYPAGDWKLDKDGNPDWYLKTNHSADSPICQLLLDPEFVYEVDKTAFITYDKAKKFVYRVGSTLIKITSPKKGLNTKDNCGSILAKDFIELWDTGILKAKGPEAQEIILLMSIISYWTSVRKRLAAICLIAQSTPL